MTTLPPINEGELSAGKEDDRQSRGSAETIICQAFKGLGVCTYCLSRLCGHDDDNDDDDDDVNNLAALNPDAPETGSSCGLCLGLLEHCNSTAITPVRNAISTSAFEGDGHELHLALPPLCVFREYVARCHLQQSLIEAGFGQNLTKPVVELKAAVLRRLKTEVDSNGFKQLAGQGGQFSVVHVDLSFAYEGPASADLECLEESDGRGQRRCKWRGRGSGEKRCKIQQETCPVSVGRIRQVLDGISPSRCIEVVGANKLTDKLKRIDGTASVNISIGRPGIFLRGRYVKLSRQVPQSPWYIDGERKGESSVEERIVDPLKQLYGARACRFHAEGREDIDVRMLGNGRPYVVEIQDAQKIGPTLAEAAALINASCSDVRVWGLRFCDAGDMERLQKESESHKKNYVAICWTQHELTSLDIEKINSIRDLEIQQKTPVRVLHRRTLDVRPKIVYYLQAKLLYPHYIELRISTQGGTYIKEFVHGDLGRTCPSLGSLLNCKADILQLDVEGLAEEEVPAAAERDASLRQD